jgi:O-antigen/teichoic acid export membrane protein
VANAAAFAFHVVMSRLLGPGSYGALGSILGVATVVSLAATALQAAVTQAVAGATAGVPSAPAPDARLVRPAAGTAVAGAVLLAGVGAASPVLSGFLHLSSPLPVVLFGAFAAATLVAFVPQGVHMGRLRFSAVAWALVAGAVVRLAAGPAFYALGWGLDGALAATLLGALVVLGVLWWPLRASLLPRLGGRGSDLKVSLAPATLAVASLGGVSAFVGLDSFLARHYLAPSASGYYAAAATAGRIALFLPAAVGMLAFPRLAASAGRGAEARRLLRHATAVVAVVGALSTALIEAVPRLLVAVLFGSRYAPAVAPLRILALSAFGTGLVTLWVYALLARRSPLALLPWGAVGATAAGVAVVHSSTTVVAWVVLAAGAALVAGAGLSVLRVPAGSGRPAPPEAHGVSGLEPAGAEPDRAGAGR